MKENLVQYPASFFRDNRELLYKIKVDKKTYSDIIKIILKKLFKWVDGDNDTIGGVYDTGLNGDINGRSLLNFLYSNYTNTSILINWINTQIINDVPGYNKFTQIDFYLSEWKNELNKLFIILLNNHEEIFANNSKILRIILRKSEQMLKIGDTAESITVKRLKESGITNIKQSKRGDVNDYGKGIDIEFEYKGERYTVQTKTYKILLIEQNEYIFKEVSGIEKYDVDFISLYNKNHGFYMFDFDDITIINSGSLKVPINKKKKLRK